MLAPTNPFEDKGCVYSLSFQYVVIKPEWQAGCPSLCGRIYTSSMCGLGGEISGRWSQLASGRTTGYILHWKMHGGNGSGRIERVVAD